MKKLFLLIYWALTGLGLSLVLSGLFSGLLGAIASTQPGSPVPTIVWQKAQLPDWGNISFDSLPSIDSSGSFAVSPQNAALLGYNPSRSWQQGQSVASVVTLGDIREFGLETLNLQAIAQITGNDLVNLKLSDLGVMPFQTLDSLMQAVPNLAEFPIQQVQPVADLLSQQLVTNFDVGETIGAFLSRSPHLKDLSLSNLTQDYPLSSIPNLDSASLGAFKDWEAVPIDGIPGLSEVPFSQFPNPINPVGSAVGIVDIVFGTKEQLAERTISGSDVEGFNVKCSKECAHLELAGASDIRGKQWISGKYQEVKGGHGILATVNDGKEPTGRHPFGPAFKVVVWDVSETQARATQALFFRICMGQLGCTPYFIGPVPWLSYDETSSMFLGVVSGQSGQASVSTPIVGVEPPSTASRQGNSAAIALAPPTAGNCNSSHRGIVLDALKNAVSDVEGNYDSVGAYSCDGKNCGVGLGTHQMMSYRSDVRSVIESKSGGKEFLSKVDGQKPIKGEEMMQYFSPIEQDALFKEDAKVLVDRASQEIDPRTAQPFQGKRLLERVGQMHFAGPGIPIDSTATDIHGVLDVQSYGNKIASNYGQALNQLGCR